MPSLWAQRWHETFKSAILPCCLEATQNSPSTHLSLCNLDLHEFLDQLLSCDQRDALGLSSIVAPDEFWLEEPTTLLDTTRDREFAEKLGTLICLGIDLGAVIALEGERLEPPQVLVIQSPDVRI